MEAVLAIAGSDSSGGAGIQADIKTIAAHHLFAETALTAITAQNTTGVYGVMNIDASLVAKQIDVVFDDIRPAAVKIGMVPSTDSARAIAESLQHNQACNIVLDPVMVATSGSALIADEAVEALVQWLFPLASIVTPNIPEAEVLCGFSIQSEDDMHRAAHAIATLLRVGTVLIKGGHGFSAPDKASCEDKRVASGREADESACANDLLRLSDGSFLWVSAPRIDTHNTHGTGCTLSSALACGLAQGLSIEEAVKQAKSYVSAALSTGLNLGRGNGPLDHLFVLAS